MNKQALKEELVDLRMKLAEAENQAIKIRGQFPPTTYRRKLAHGARVAIQEADEKVIEIAQILGLDKLDVVKPERVNR